MEHLKIFKACALKCPQRIHAANEFLPNQLRRQPFQSTIGEELSDRVRTPKFSASCGVTDLRVDRQYLLAGRFGEGRELLIFSCGSIPAQDGRQTACHITIIILSSHSPFFSRRFQSPTGDIGVGQSAEEIERSSIEPGLSELHQQTVNLAVTAR